MEKAARALGRIQEEMQGQTDRAMRRPSPSYKGSNNMINRLPSTTTTTSSPHPQIVMSHSFSSTNTTTMNALRVVHHRHAAKVAAHEHIVRLHAKKLLNLQREIEHEAAQLQVPPTILCKGYTTLATTSMVPWRASAPSTMALSGGRG